MRIRRLRIDGFSSLRGDFIFSSDRCNLILEPNESGKSTLAAAILAALYGFPRQRTSREKPIKMKDQFRPWGGGPFALELELECRERGYTIRRDFDRDTVAVLDGQTGREITAEYSRGKDQVDVGEALTGLSREDFSHCCFVGQREIESLRDGTSLTHALQRIASSQQGDIAAGEALDALSHAADRDFEGMRLGKGKVDTEIKRLEKEIDEVRSEMEAIAARRRESEAKIRRLEEATVMEGRAETDLARTDYLCLLAARQEVEAGMRQCAAEEEELQRYRDEIPRLQPYAHFPIERAGQLREMKGRIETLLERRSASEQKLIQELEAAVKQAEMDLTPFASFDALGAQEVAALSDRQAVLQDLWRLRREKRRALRRAGLRLAAAGLDPERVKELASSLASLSDGDRAFLAGYREKTLEVKAALSEAERDRDRLARAEGGEVPTLVSLAAARRAETIALALGSLGIVLTCVLWFTPFNKLALVFTAFLAGAGFIWWLRLQEKRPVHGAEEFGSELQRTQTDIWSREKEMAALQERLSNLAVKMSSSSPERLVEEFRELEGFQDGNAPFGSLAASLQEVQSRYASTASELLNLMEQTGRSPASGLLTPRAARRFREDLDRYLGAQRRLQQSRADLDAGVKDLASMVLQIESLRAEAARIFAAGMGPDEPFEDLGEALALFEAAAAKREGWERLTKEILPASERRNAVAPAQRRAALSKELDVLTRQIERALRQSPEMEGLAPERSSRAYAEERRRLQEEIRSTQRERLGLSEELGDVLKEYRRDFPGRQVLLESLEAAHRRATAFRDAVAIASEVLSTISKEAYAEWAEILNEKTSEILRRINPNYEDVRFDTDLSFTLRDARIAKRLDQAAVDVQLSSGARDQVYLAVRLAVSEYLSAAGVRLPLILDDPFATFDDERFSRAMEFLLDTPGRRHQIILLSCHRDRHRRWQEDLAERHSDKVRVLDLTPLST